MIISENTRCYEIRQKASNILKELNIDTSTAIDVRMIIASLGNPIALELTDPRGILALHVSIRVRVDIEYSLTRIFLLFVPLH